MKSWFHRLFQTSSRRSKQAAPRRTLTLEVLEDRTVPTVLYYGGPVLPNVEVQGLYVGNQWTANPTLRAQKGDLEGFLSDIVNSTYMDTL